MQPYSWFLLLLNVIQISASIYVISMLSRSYLEQVLTPKLRELYNDGKSISHRQILYMYFANKYNSNKLLVVLPNVSRKMLYKVYGRVSKESPYSAHRLIPTILENRTDVDNTLIRELYPLFIKDLSNISPWDVTETLSSLASNPKIPSDVLAKIMYYNNPSMLKQLHSLDEGSNFGELVSVAGYLNPSIAAALIANMNTDEDCIRVLRAVDNDKFKAAFAQHPNLTVEDAWHLANLDSPYIQSFVAERCDLNDKVVERLLSVNHPDVRRALAANESLDEWVREFANL